jgi:bile acid-coenzyme A ligase
MLIPMADVPRWHADRNGHDCIAIVHGGDRLNWGDFERHANSRARALMDHGVKPGDFVAVGLPNSNQFYENTFAIYKCGATPCSLSYRLPRGEAAAILDLLKPALVIGGEEDWKRSTARSRATGRR